MDDLNKMFGKSTQLNCQMWSMENQECIVDLNDVELYKNITWSESSDICKSFIRKVFYHGNFTDENKTKLEKIINIIEDRDKSSFIKLQIKDI
jgi:hypothetical protein